MPVMRIDAKRPVMLNVVDRAKACFIVEHEKVLIKIVVVNELSQNILFRMSITTKLSEFALVQVVREVDTEPSLVIVGVIIEFNRVMAILAAIHRRTFFVISSITTHET